MAPSLEASTGSPVAKASAMVIPKVSYNSEEKAKNRAFSSKQTPLAAPYIPRYQGFKTAADRNQPPANFSLMAAFKSLKFSSM